ncbi:1,4-beta-N-acetylmuramidase, partial [Weissella uvarum]|nr:1,4-beta-N-acetylmuramidase [Weissella uvarum]
KLWQAIYPTSGNTQYYPYAVWLRNQTSNLPTFGKADIVQYGDGGGLDWNYNYGNYQDLTGVNPYPHTPNKPTTKPKPAVKKTATFKNVYVLDKWHKLGQKWYVSNKDFSIPVEDYNNYIPAGSVTLTDRYGHKLKNQNGQGNNGKMEYFTLNGKYKVLAKSGSNVKLEIGGEPVWLKSKYVTIK